MRAARVHTLDGPRAMTVDEVEPPEREAGQVRIAVHHAGVAFPDALLTRGLYQYRPDPPFVPGSEVAGEVLEAPDDSGFTVGERVAAIPFFGGFAEEVVCSPDQVFPLPEGTTTEVGAALPMNYLTVEFALDRRGRLAVGETVLVHGAAGGIGTASIQYAAASGARVIAVTSTEEKARTARDAGAHETVLAEGFRDAVRELTDGRGVDVVVDPVGGDRFVDSLRSLAPEGRLLVIGFTAGDIPTVKVNRLLLNNIEVVGVGWGAFVLPQPHLMPEQWRRLVPHVESGALDPPIHAVLPLDEVGDALATLEERRARGKVLLDLTA